VNDSGVDASSALAPIFLIQDTSAAELELFTFDPGSLTVTRVGPLQCPDGGGPPTLFAVNRALDGYLAFVASEGVYHVDTQTAACTATGSRFDAQWPLEASSSTFAEDAASNESLYSIAKDRSATSWLVSEGSPPAAVHPIGPLSTSYGETGQLMAAGRGSLFTIATVPFSSGPSAILKIDTESADAQFVAPVPVDMLGPTSVFYGGEFYFFDTGWDARGDTSSVTRFRADDGTSTVLAWLPGITVLAAVREGD
jgi:hypothetical protein